MSQIEKELNRLFENFDLDNPTPEQIEHFACEAEFRGECERDDKMMRDIEKQEK